MEHQLEMWHRKGALAGAADFLPHESTMVLERECLQRTLDKYLLCEVFFVWFFFFLTRAVTWWDQDFSLPGLQPLFAPFVGMQMYPNPDWYSCDLLIYCINTFCFPSDTTGLLLLGTNMVSSMVFGVSDPPSSAQGRWQGPFLARFSTNPTSSEIPQQNYSRAAKVFVLNSLSESPG